MAITAWSAKVSSSAICAVGEGRAPRGGRATSTPIGRAVPQQRHRQDGPRRPLSRHALGGRPSLGARRRDVGDVDVRRPSTHGPIAGVARASSAGAARSHGGVAPVVAAGRGHAAEVVALDASRSRRPAAPQQARRALGDRVRAPRCRSVGDAAMTRSTSPVAVCCSRASVSVRLLSCSSANRRAFSIAITAWSAKVSTRRDLAVGEGLRPRVAATVIAPIGRAVAEQGHREAGCGRRDARARRGSSYRRARRRCRAGARAPLERSPGRRRSRPAGGNGPAARAR